MKRWVVLAPNEPDRTRGTWWSYGDKTRQEIVDEIEKQTGQSWYSLYCRGWRMVVCCLKEKP